MPTVKELKEQAKDAGIGGYSTMKKADLIAALKPASDYAWTTEAERQEARARYIADKQAKE